MKQYRITCHLGHLGTIAADSVYTEDGSYVFHQIGEEVASIPMSFGWNRHEVTVEEWVPEGRNSIYGDWESVEPMAVPA